MSKCSCQDKYSYYYYCKPCGSAYFRDNFAHWTSGDSNIDELIQNSQLHANNESQFIEWVEYTNLENVKFIAHGGFGTVYKAIWKDGPIWKITRNDDKFELQRSSNKEVA